MNFREVLSRLHSDRDSLSRVLCGFDARQTAVCLNISVKNASNYLRRLYQMGFLKRSKTKRLCIPSALSFEVETSQKAFYRGYKYFYSFNKKGLNYLKWLREIKPIEDIFYAMMTYEVMSNLPKNLRDRLSAYVLTRTKYRGPARNLQLFDNAMVPLVNLLIQNRGLAEENSKLTIEKALLQLRHEQTVEERIQDKKMSYEGWAATIIEAARYKKEAEEWKKRAEHFGAVLNVAREVINETRRFSEEKFEEYRTLTNKLLGSD